MLRDTAFGVELDVRVIPRARRTELAGLRGDDILIRLAAPPVEGAANSALVAFVADWLDVPVRAIQIVSGAKSRRKRLEITGVNAALVRSRLPSGSQGG